MTEIDGKKYYSLREITEFPSNTNFKQTIDAPGIFYTLWKSDDGVIDILQHHVRIDDSLKIAFLLQDRFEIVEEPKPEREYVDGPDALRKLMNGEWEKIACDHEEWKERNDYLEVNLSELDLVGLDCVFEVLSPEFLKLKRWYEYKD